MTVTPGIPAPDSSVTLPCMAENRLCCANAGLALAINRPRSRTTTKRRMSTSFEMGTDGSAADEGDPVLESDAKETASNKAERRTGIYAGNRNARDDRCQRFRGINRQRFFWGPKIWLWSVNDEFEQVVVGISD